MPTPRDDDFSLSTLNSKWAWINDPSSTSSYSLISNPGKFTLTAGVGSSLWVAGTYSLSTVARLIQNNDYQYYAVEAGVSSAVLSGTHNSGLFVRITDNSCLLLIKEGTGIFAYEIVAGDYRFLGGIYSGIPNTAYVLRIEYKAGVVRFLHKSYTDTNFSQVLSDYTPHAGDYSHAQVGLFSDSHATNPPFATEFDYFHLRSLANRTVNANTKLTCVNTKVVNANTKITTVHYEPVTNFEVKQDAQSDKVYLSWTAPTDPSYLFVRIVRKVGSYPTHNLDGDFVTVSPPDTAYIDTLPQSMLRAQVYYSAFAFYTDDFAYPQNDSTMPVLFRLFNNLPRIFTRAFGSVVYAIAYSLARALVAVGVLDYAEAMKQFNVNTASGEFLDLWGSWFGTKRYSNESDAVFSKRIIKRVVDPRTITASILSAVLAVDGVTYATISDEMNGALFVGHSFIGFEGALGFETQSDFISNSLTALPLFFTVFVKVKTGTDFQRIISAIKDIKAGGIRFAVQILPN